MIPNCVITAWRRRTGTQGDGSPSYTAVALGGLTIPAMLGPLSWMRQVTAQQAGHRLDRAVTVEPAALRAAGATLPGVGDEITLAARPGAAATAYVVEQVDQDGAALTAEPIPGAAMFVRLFLREVA